VIRDGLARREVLSRDADPFRAAPAGRSGVAHMYVDEPTGDLAGPGPKRGLLSRLDARTRSILTAAAVAAVLVNAGAVWAYWHITGSETGQAANADAVVELNLRARSGLSKPLTPGGTGDLTVTVTNDNNFPIRITSVSLAPGAILADDEHRENGCADHGVVMVPESAAVRWNVARNSVGAFTVPGGLRMAPDSDAACAGATFSIPVLVSGSAGAS
jgi:hypothetical protein